MSTKKGRKKLSPQERIKIASAVCEMYASDKYTIESCLNNQGISETTWRNWQADVAEIAELYKKAIEQKGQVYRKELIGRARTALEKHLEGYTVEITETDGEAYTDASGAQKIKTTRVRKKQIYIRPSFAAAAFVLTNMDAVNFQYRPERPEEIQKSQDEKLLEDWTDEEINEALKKYDGYSAAE